MSVWQDKTVLVTGGTGSLGTALIRLLFATEPDIKAIRTLSRTSEKRDRLKAKVQDSRLRCFMGDVTNAERLEWAFDGVDIVIHAAAAKRIDEGEAEADEYIDINVDGGRNVIKASIRHDVERLLVISTDKAANPISVYGSTKLLLERAAIAYDKFGTHRTRISAARYGNVIASAGSIVPALIEQRKTGVVKLTAKEMSRFWISLPEAARFVKGRVEEMAGGELFVPQMPSIWITDLLEALAPECRVEVTGIRGVEKMAETLVTIEESRNASLSHDGERWFYTIGRVPVRDDAFLYASDTNEKFLTVEEIRSTLLLPILEAAA